MIIIKIIIIKIIIIIIIIILFIYCKFYMLVNNYTLETKGTTRNK